jgi:hypothetical protein
VPGVTRALCIISGCDRPHYAHGWCELHYQRWRKHGDPLVAIRPQDRSLISIGSRFGRLTIAAAPVVRGTGKTAKRFYPCECECGGKAIVRAAQLMGGGTRSCGCLRYEGLGSTTHGLSGHPLYGVWAAMHRRCDSPAVNGYERYGGRGIYVCSRWSGANGFPNFLADMGPKPTLGHSIDRIDNDGPYAPVNCRWATKGEQRANRSDSR